MSKEIIDLLEKAKRQLACTLDKQHYTAYTKNIDQALTLLKQQPTAGEWTKDFREQLAELCHEQWSGWINYMFSKCSCHSRLDGIRVIPDWAVKRWTRQVATPYAELSPKEQDSDRAEADKFISLIQSCLDTSEAINKDLLELCEEFMEIADDGSASFDDPEPGSIYLRAEATIAKAKKEGDKK